MNSNTKLCEDLKILLAPKALEDTAPAETHLGALVACMI